MLREMLRYQVAYFLPRDQDRMVVAEVLDFPGVVSQGFHLPDARTMIASALADTARAYLGEGKALPLPAPDATAADAGSIELVPSRRHLGIAKAPGSGRGAPHIVNWVWAPLEWLKI
jgi:predicted RNase H-like HicB family nuclease